MKITVLHGEDVVKSRDRLFVITQTLRDRGWIVSNLENDGISIKEKLATTSLFGEERLLVSENGLGVSKSDYEWLGKNAAVAAGNLVFWFPSTVNVSVKSKLPKNTHYEVFPLPKEIFSLLNEFYPGNTNKFLKMFHRVVEKEPEEFVFAVLAKNLRDLYWAKVSPESLPYPRWLIAKIQSQSGKFSLRHLESLIDSFSAIDVEAKSGGLGISRSIDLSLPKNLE